jgi:aspartate-semialdehyde dehydrogenase
MSNRPAIAVVGASGAVGEVMLSILADRGYREGEVIALASERSAGQDVDFGNVQLTVEDLATFDFSKTDYALFSAGGSVSEEYAPRAAEAGAVVIDNTSAFRYDDDIPLVVPEVNPEALAGINGPAIIANPNCSTIQMVVALAPIHRAVGISRINVATYQSVSGAGRQGLHELAMQTAARLNFKELASFATTQQTP